MNPIAPMSRIVVLRIQCASCAAVTEVAVGCHPGDARPCRSCGKTLRVDSTKVLSVSTIQDRRKAPRACPHA